MSERTALLSSSAGDPFWCPSSRSCSPLGPRLAPCCCYYHSAMPVIMPRGAPELRDSPNLEAKSVTDLTLPFIGRKRSSVDECLSHAWIQPKNKTDRLTRRKTEINIENFKNFHARRRWKVSQFSLESDVPDPLQLNEYLVRFSIRCAWSHSATSCRGRGARWGRLPRFEKRTPCPT